MSLIRQTTLLPRCDLRTLSPSRGKSKEYLLRMEEKNVSNYFRINEALAERLMREDGARGSLPYSKLKVQYRAHEGLAGLTRALHYTELKDASNTEDFPKLEGFGERPPGGRTRNPRANRTSQKPRLIACQTPRYPPVTSSCYNMYEVECTVALVKYLLASSHYRPDDIAVLTPYNGQLKKLMEAFDESMDV